ncbi:thaumatin family protein [Streptacidiphilus sp. PAMC 29251]
MAAVVIIYWATSPADSVGPQTTGRTVVAAGSTGSSSAPASAGSPTGPSPSVQPSPSTHVPPTSTSTASQSRAKPKATAGGAGTTGPKQAAPTGSQRSITLVNRTQQTIWAIVTNTSAYPDGRKLQPGQSTSLTVANNWGGRIWGRTGCATTGRGTCLTGDCTVQCSGPTTPTTLGEFTFDAFDNLDFYDVSMVDGSNLPMYINVSHTVTTDPVSAAGCYKGACTKPIVCPSAMQAVSGGQVIGCKPPCAAFGGDTYCCRGAWAGRDNCVPSKWPVDYTQVFKKAEPYAYSYAFDDSATMACKAQCYYRVTFGTSG